MKEDILDFNPRSITADSRESVEKLLKKNSESFDPEVNINKILTYFKIKTQNLSII